MTKPLKNQRKHTRFPSTTDGILLTVPVDAVDESFGGIGMVLPMGWNIDVGTMIHVDYDGAPMLGRVRHQRETEDGRIRVGLAWVPFETADSNSDEASSEQESPQVIGD